MRKWCHEQRVLLVGTEKSVSPIGDCQSKSAAAGGDRPAIILDGNVTRDKLVWLYYDSDEPRFETICTHGTELNSIPGQASHAHPSTDKAGNCIAFNVAKDKRTDVWVVEI